MDAHGRLLSCRGQDYTPKTPAVSPAEVSNGQTPATLRGSRGRRSGTGDYWNSALTSLQVAEAAAVGEPALS